jgi:hypothetical protein
VIKVELKDAGLIAKLAAVREALLPGAVRRALDRTAVTAKAEAGRLIAEDTGLAVGVAKGAVKVTKSATSVSLSLPYKRIPLIEFKAKGPEPSRGKGSGVSYRLPTGRGRLPHAFITTMPSSGHRGVFQRVPGKFMKNKPNRQAIAEALGPSLGRVFEKVMPKVEEKAQDALVKNISHEINRATGGTK